jgi:NNP family nitrate/nitrite transporter-like MFS transporter
MTWMAFFLCFFGWFGLAPLMPLVRADLHLTPTQVANSVIASVAGTIFARLLVGYLCDKYGPRRVYSGLLALGALPVMGVGLAHDYASFMVCRVLIGLVGASFVITQYHTSAMFAPSVVGTANATTAGWGNLGGGVTQMVMPLVVLGLVGLGIAQGEAWRYAMIVPGALMLVMSVCYLRFTQDSPESKDAKANTGKSKGSLLEAARDARVGALFIGYGACFGVELTIHNVAASYFHDRFQLGLKEAGMLAGSFGVLAIFARSLGGYLGDRAGRRYGLAGRGRFLTAMLFAEGIGLIVFSRMGAVGAGGDRAGHVRLVRAHRSRRDVLGGAVHQAQRGGRGGRHRGRRREHRRGAGRLAVPWQRRQHPDWLVVAGGRGFGGGRARGDDPLRRRAGPRGRERRALAGRVI